MSKKIKLSNITPDDKNNNKHTAYGMDLLEKSVNKVGIIESITVSNDDKIISGNARHEVIGKNFTKEAIVIETDGTQPIIIKRTDIESNTKQFYEASILANTTAKKNIDFDIGVIESLSEEYDIDIQDLGVDIVEEEHLEAEEDDFNGTPPKEPITVLGDLYEIGEHRLLCGDSTCSDTVGKLMNGEKADMVFTDPPYNVDYEGKTKEKLKIQNDKHSLSEFRMFISDVITNLILFTKKGGCYYVCIPLEVGVTDLFLEKTHLQSVLIWLKNVIVMGRKDYQQKTEPILFLTNLDEESTEEETYNGIVYGWIFGDSHKYYGGRKQSNVWQFDKPKRNGEHPTMKPILLVAKAINNSSKQSDLVLDLFLGSGSTMVASHQLKRKCYGMELDCKYCDVIVARMIKLDSTLPIKRNGTLLTKSELEKFTANTSGN